MQVSVIQPNAIWRRQNVLFNQVFGFAYTNLHTSDLVYTFNMPKFKKGCTKGHVTETQQNVTTCLVDAWLH